MQLYAAMVKSRMIAERTAELARQGKLPHHWGNEIGSEATLAGITADLRLDDTVSAPGNRLLLSVIDGISLKEVLGSIADPVNGHGLSVSGQNWNLRPEKNGHSARIASDRSLKLDFSAATEAAEAHKAANDGKIALAFFKDPGASDLRGKRLKLVSSRNLPMVLFCHYSSEGHQERFLPSRERITVANDALAFGVARIAVDARDVLAVYRVASESISRARQRRGPTLIECIDQGPHARARISGPADPVRAMESYLRKKRILTSALNQQIESRFSMEIEAATSFLVN
jgi:acetoin:2,6-dichlorophenolindophenol oxidoreductase subunit alpha